MVRLSLKKWKKSEQIKSKVDELSKKIFANMKAKSVKCKNENNVVRDFYISRGK
jgi:hypothetical protein